MLCWVLLSWKATCVMCSPMYAARSCIVSASSLSSNLEPNSPMTTGRTTCRLTAELSQSRMRMCPNRCCSTAEVWLADFLPAENSSCAAAHLSVQCTGQSARLALEPCKACLVLNKSACTHTAWPASYSVTAQCGQHALLRRNGYCRYALSSAHLLSALAQGPWVWPTQRQSQKTCWPADHWVTRSSACPRCQMRLPDAASVLAQ